MEVAIKLLKVVAPTASAVLLILFEFRRSRVYDTFYKTYDSIFKAIETIEGLNLEMSNIILRLRHLNKRNIQEIKYYQEIHIEMKQIMATIDKSISDIKFLSHRFKKGKKSYKKIMIIVDYLQHFLDYGYGDLRNLLSILDDGEILWEYFDDIVDLYETRDNSDIFFDRSALIYKIEYFNKNKIR